MATARVARAAVAVLLPWLSACGDPPFRIEDRGEFARVVPAGARLERLAGGLAFTEGPVWTGGGGGFLVFSDMTAGRLMRWSEADGLTVLRDPVPEPNGNARDAVGRLLTCEHGSRSITRTEPDGVVVTLMDRFAGCRLNSPNDLAVRADGSIWFTDPSYGLRGRPRELESDGVFRWDPGTGALALVATDFHRPNGIAWSPDERTLYVADSGRPRHVRAFQVAEDGRLTGGAVLYRVDAGIPDGLCCDVDGRLYVSAGDGVHVVRPDGTPIGRILCPESVANVAFGGAARRDLFITAGRSLYRIRLAVPGAPLPGG